MKQLFFLATLVLFTSFSRNKESRILPNGHYAAVLDEKYELNNYEILIQDDVLVLTLLNKSETYELNWIDGNSFVVKGYTEPKNPNSFEQEMLNSFRPLYIITKQENDTYYFKLGTKEDPIPIYSGKFIKIK